MNLAQIQAGDYSSLLGTWKEVAWAVNDYDMNNPGVHWHAGSASSVDTISVSSDRIVFDGMGVAMQGNTLTDNNGAHALLLQSRGGSLDASLADQSVAINWGVYFYPIGATEVSSDFQPDNGVTIDNTKNLIVIWTSNMGATTVFAQQ
ncbi:MAG: DUF6287 domain-containing protein [Propionibacteriaceae bacterium]|nr:DUF6287 domain-containing protein [Propionibacteriaceae bacterium]